MKPCEETESRALQDRDRENPVLPDQARYSPGPPPLPPGYVAQPVAEFGDGTGRFSVEFNRVYRPPTRNRRGESICLQDEDRSYWRATWVVFSDAGDSRRIGRSVSYTEARKLLGSRLTFERFSSLREQLAELLHSRGGHPG